MNLNRLRFALLASTALAATAFACGGISDPTRVGAGEGNVATVSGALTGTTVPANAHVALVWHVFTAAPGGGHTSLEVGSDVPVVDGKFTMNLGAPPANYLVAVDGHSLGDLSSSPPVARTAPVPAEGPKPAPAGGSSGALPAVPAGKLTPRDLVGGSITEPMTAAIAGFVVYVDANGNGKLDLEGEYSSSPDQLIGGNKELLLAYLQGGGALDYEKLRDKSGILPAAGFNLAWTEGRWLPLNVVELKLLAKPKLPSAICDKYYAGSSGGSGGSDPIATTPPSSGGSGGSSGSSGSSGTSGGTGKWYPSPSDPGLKCSPDGTSFTYSSAPSCPPPPPPAVGLCANDYGDSTRPCSGYGYVDSIPPGGPVPDGWPCTVTAPLDGGSPDSGVTDAGAGPG